MPYTVKVYRYGPGEGIERPTKEYPGPFPGPLLTPEEIAVWEYLKAVESERDKLLAFKAYVHKRLDDAGVPADPESPHKAAGCRIGGRLDELIRERDHAQRLDADSPPNPPAAPEAPKPAEAKPAGKGKK